MPHAHARECAKSGAAAVAYRVGAHAGMEYAYSYSRPSLAMSFMFGVERCPP